MTSYTRDALRPLQQAAIEARDLDRVHDAARAHGQSRPHAARFVRKIGTARLQDSFCPRGGWFCLGLIRNGIASGDAVSPTGGPPDVVACFNLAKITRPWIRYCKLCRKTHAATRTVVAGLDDLAIFGALGNLIEMRERIAPLVRQGDMKAIR